MRNAAERPGFELNKLPSPFQFFTFSSFPLHLGYCSRLMELSPNGLREWSLLSCLWPRSGWCSCSSSWLLHSTLYLAFPISHFSLKWSKTLLPKSCPCSPRDVLLKTHIWTSPPSLLACCFLISISPWLNLAAVPNILAAYHLVYRLHLPFPLTSPPVPSLHLLLSWLPPASMACTLDGRIPLCLAASLNIFLAFGNINASSFKILCIPTDFQQSCFWSHTDFQGASAPPLFL